MAVVTTVTAIVAAPTDFLDRGRLCADDAGSEAVHCRRGLRGANCAERDKRTRYGRKRYELSHDAIHLLFVAPLNLRCASACLPPGDPQPASRGRREPNLNGHELMDIHSPWIGYTEIRQIRASCALLAGLGEERGMHPEGRSFLPRLRQGSRSSVP